MIQTHIIPNRNLQQLQNKQLRQRAESVAALSSLKREPLNRILNLARILLIIVRIAMEPALNSFLRELAQSSFGLDSNVIVISGVVG